MIFPLNVSSFESFHFPLASSSTFSSTKSLFETSNSNFNSKNIKSISSKHLQITNDGGRSIPSSLANSSYLSSESSFLGSSPLDQSITAQLKSVSVAYPPPQSNLSFERLDQPTRLPCLQFLFNIIKLHLERLKSSSQHSFSRAEAYRCSTKGICGDVLGGGKSIR